MTSRFIASKILQKNEAEKYYNEQVVDLKLGQYLCPMCRQLSNAVIPLPALHTGVPSTPVPPAPMSSTGFQQFSSGGGFSATASTAASSGQLMRTSSRAPTSPNCTELCISECSFD